MTAHLQQDAHGRGAERAHLRNPLAGNLATTQAVIAHAKRDMSDPDADISLRTVRHMFDAAEYIGQLSVRAQKLVTNETQYSSVNVETTLILAARSRRGAGDLPDLPTRQLHLGKPGDAVLQIGETKYGKPILDRFIHPEVRLEDAARCALVSLDSTMRSNISVGPPVGRRHPAARRAQRDTQAALDTDTPITPRCAKAGRGSSTTPCATCRNSSGKSSVRCSSTCPAAIRTDS